MSMIPTQGQSIIVESPESLAQDYEKIPRAAEGQLCGWIMGRVNIWEDVRNRGYHKLWGEYWRLWRGKWLPEDVNRLSERSKLVAPALSQAIEQTVSEIEEAIFSKDEWLEVAVGKISQEIASQLQAQLIDDLDLVNAKDQIIEAVMNGAIFGSMIAKVNVYVGDDQTPKRDETTFELKASGNRRVFVSIDSIRPDEFVPDPVGRTISQMEGCAQRIQRPLHYVLEQIEKGTYRKSALNTLVSNRRIKNSDIDLEDPQSINTTYESGQVDIVEYHGKVPARYLLEADPNRKQVDDELMKDISALESNGEGPLVECIVTIANQGTLLRAMVNPFAMKDRSIVACQFEKVPGRFWGRGVAEKGYNPQKALDCEIRARMDALGYVSAPMLGVDSGRLPRGFKYEVKPGKVWPTQGNPTEVLQPVKIGELNALTFQQTQEMERMVQMGTGSFDTATALRAQSQSGANGASSNSALMGAFVKRSKRAVAGISRNFLFPLVQKVLWRYMQFDPVRYPASFDVKINTTMGIIAREVEASQLTQLMGMMPEDYHQAKLVLAKGIVDHTSISNKAEVMKVIDAVLNPTPEQQKAQAAKQKQQDDMAAATVAKLQAEVKKIEAEVAKLTSDAQQGAAKLQIASAAAQDNNQRVQQDWQHVSIAHAEQQQFAEQNRIALMNVPINRLKAEAAMVSARKKTSA